MAKNSGKGTIVVKRVEEGHHGHHGGAWKVAYADFVTAMMAFFLLMWLLNATTEDQRRGLADYFAPANLLGRSVTGSGQPFGGRTPNETRNQASSNGAPDVQTSKIPLLTDLEDEDESTIAARPTPRREGDPGEDEEANARRLQAGQGDVADPVDPGKAAQMSEQALREELARHEQRQFEQIAEQIKQIVKDDPGLSDLGKQLMVEQVPEGLRIQLLDAERQSMFASGGSSPNEKSRALIARVAQVINRLPNAVAITGHTDATPFRGGDRTNWDLSAERANVTRRLLTESGVADDRIRSVAGLAAREPLLPNDPNNASNRRVAILLLRENPAPGTMPR
ncbi:OmpA family protein [Acetobacteraceae bacterium H6797]|nr:OmpA family protein [Acetobacteraceae bacterium H6797]